MILDGRRLTENTILKCDICIIGAGAAGLTLAQDLEHRGFSILLIDSGGFDEDPAVQALNQGSSNDPAYPFLEARARRFGGTTSRWSGVCIPLDEDDFITRSWLPFSGWPFELAELQPYYEKAQHIFGLPPCAAYIPQTQNDPFHQASLVTKVLLHSNPLDLGKKYQRQIEQSSSITAILQASVTQLHLDDTYQRIDYLAVQTLAGNHFSIRSKVIILAAGGIENARLLLASNTEIPEGIGNQHGNVGRYHMEHPMNVVGVLAVGEKYPQTISFTNNKSSGGLSSRRTFGLAPEIRRREQLLDVHMRLYRYSLLEDTTAVVAAKSLQRGWRQGHLPELFTSTWPVLRPHLGDVLMPYLRWHLWNKIGSKAKFDHVRMNAVIEQEPDPANRITLSESRDPFGRPLPHLHYQLSDYLRQSLTRSLQLIDQAFRAHGFGPFRYQPEAIAHLEPYNKHGLHHMGATRMHINPQFGVVDAHCRVHGVENLFIAGSSLFPTSGAANPTLTISALALRLSSHLKTNWS